MHHYRDAHALFRSYLILAYRGDYRRIHAFDEHVDDARSKEEAACDMTIIRAYVAHTSPQKCHQGDESLQYSLFFGIV